MRKEDPFADIVTPSAEAPMREVISPRVILLDPNGSFVLVLHEGTGWWGLPGGKFKVGEVTSGLNLLGIGVFPTLRREVSEEVGINISLYQPIHFTCLGVTEVHAVDSENRQITRITSPIFVYKVPDLLGIKQNTVLLASYPFPGPLFPDARIALKYYFDKARTNSGELITPEFLNQGEVFYFQMKPKPQLLMGSPSWA